MDPETVASLRLANESSIMLLTLLLEGNDAAAADLIFKNPVAYRGPTCMAIGVLAVGALKTLAQVFEVDPQELIQIAGLNAAQLVMEYEIDDEGLT